MQAKRLAWTYLRDAGKSHDVKMKLQADDGIQLSSKTELPALDGATLKDYDAKGVKGIRKSPRILPNSAGCTTIV